MSEYNIRPSFRPEIDGPNTPTYTMMSGVGLRNLYVTRKYAAQIVDWLDDNVDPNCVGEGVLDGLIVQWTSEAETLYPGQGDYRVRILDDAGNRIVIGSEVTFIVESEQVAIDPCESGTPSCPDRIVVFQICNSNSAIDDNFDIYLNNTYIGAVDLSTNAQVGSVFIASLDVNLNIVSDDFDCLITNMVVYRFEPTLLQTSNILEMRNTQNNGNNNAGSVGIRNYLLTGTDLSAPCVIADLEYGPAPSGVDFTLNFEYTQCCP